MYSLNQSLCLTKCFVLRHMFLLYKIICSKKFLQSSSSTGLLPKVAFKPFTCILSNLPLDEGGAGALAVDTSTQREVHHHTLGIETSNRNNNKNKYKHQVVLAGLCKDVSVVRPCVVRVTCSARPSRVHRWTAPPVRWNTRCEFLARLRSYLVIVYLLAVIFNA